MGLLRVIFVGGLAATGALIALRKARPVEAPGEGAGEVAEGAATDPLSAIRRRTDEALAAAHEAQQEKEEELRRQFEDAKRSAAS